MSHVSCIKTIRDTTKDIKTEEDLPFDFIVRQKWKEAQKNGIFRYILNIRHSKILDGKYQFLMQLNVDRGSNRRPPENIVSMKQSFDQNRFNFLKLPREEEIMSIKSKEEEEDIIVINASPIEYCHSLLLPQRCKMLPQVVTKYSLYKAIELFSLSSSPYLRVGFNSLCAYASVNHLHWHFYYLKQTMLLEYINVGKYAGPVEVLENYPAKGFCIKYSNVSTIEEFVNWAYLIINYMQNAEIAHNVYITRAKVRPTEEHTDLRLYIWARKSMIGAKCSDAFNVALCELFGHLSIKSEETYRSLTEEHIAEALRNTTEETFFAVIPEIKVLIIRGINN